jgi:hypothetical protein
MMINATEYAGHGLSRRQPVSIAGATPQAKLAA